MAAEALRKACKLPIQNGAMDVVDLIKHSKDKLEYGSTILFCEKELSESEREFLFGYFTCLQERELISNLQDSACLWSFAVLLGFLISLGLLELLVHTLDQIFLPDLPVLIWKEVAKLLFPRRLIASGGKPSSNRSGSKDQASSPGGSLCTRLCCAGGSKRSLGHSEFVYFTTYDNVYMFYPCIFVFLNL